ncbi:MAG: hypothetical protein AAB343_03965 [Patescibacteria group bacterium]
MKSIIALEGLPCSGKTEFFEKFKTSGVEMFFIPELYMDARDKVNAKDARALYTEAEKDKFKKVPKNAHTILCDRSYISTLGFSYAYGKTFWEYSTYDYNTKFFSTNHDAILVPTHVIVFRIPPEESLRRSTEKGRTEDVAYWQNIQFLSNFAAFYESDLLKTLIKSKIIFVDALNIHPEQVYGQVDQSIRQYIRK